jgi:hypothetical protein
MTVFDVWLNERRLCRAGVGPDGVLNAIVSWVKLSGEALAAARREGRASDETRLHAGGLRADTHYTWVARSLKSGDRVTVVVNRAGRRDPPARTKRRDPARERRLERQYFERLKRKYGPHQTAAGDAAATSFLNVDLDIDSRVPLERLVEAFGARVVVLHVGRVGARAQARLELAAAAKGPDDALGRFVRLVRQLPRSARRDWNRATRREFNIGIQAAQGPHHFELAIRPATLQAVAAIGGRIGLTVYGAPGERSPAGPDRGAVTRRGSRRADER